MTELVVHFTQTHRAVLIHAPDGRVFRKRARIIARPSKVPFTVETDRGIMRGEAGDWLVTNHPDDDPGSDLWSISDDRMKATYEPDSEPSIEELLHQAHALLVKAVGTGVHPLDPAVYHVELALERVARHVDVGR